MLVRCLPSIGVYASETSSSETSSGSRTSLTNLETSLTLCSSLCNSSASSGVGAEVKQKASGFKVNSDMSTPKVGFSPFSDSLVSLSNDSDLSLMAKENLLLHHSSTASWRMTTSLCGSVEINNVVSSVSSLHSLGVHRDDNVLNLVTIHGPCLVRLQMESLCNLLEFFTNLWVAIKLGAGLRATVNNSRNRLLLRRHRFLEDSGNWSLTDHTVSTVVNNGCTQVENIVEVESVQESDSIEILDSSHPSGLVTAGTLKVTCSINTQRVENAVSEVHQLRWLVAGIHWGNIAMDNGNGSLDGLHGEVEPGLIQQPLTSHDLNQVGPWQISAALLVGTEKVSWIFSDKIFALISSCSTSFGERLLSKLNNEWSLEVLVCLPFADVTFRGDPSNFDTDELLTKNPNKHHDTKETNGTTQKSNHKRNDKGVANVENHRGQATKSEFRQNQSMQEHVDRDTCANEERPPLPLVVFVAQGVVGEQKGHEESCDDHEHEAEEQESKHVVDSVEPQRVEDEVHLDGNCSEWEDTGNQGHVRSLQVPRLFRDLSWNLVHLDRNLDDLASESKKRTNTRQWDTDDEPNQHNHKHGTDWNCS
ncbi:hypothetical protein OGAPHI_001912 [Ogataea philodendri]|uniref:Uncharacterized protein n=1 Tax=Ogataea philodendri TaxID=1378263 RepID=A0A9P8P9N6_9ASCO|nr:uncharacterized protein OGAPHI_001912 [Ogataea philodendri]KAH3668158.1 hypothetical protein OGAPHI_001912 [Ogataea philodendri]